MLTEQQRLELQQLLSSGSHKARVLTRARVLLLLDQNYAEQQVSDVLNVSLSTIYRTRKRFSELGLERAVYDNPRPGRPVTSTGDVEAKLVMLACSQAPKGRSRWTLHLLADKMVELHYVDAISHQQVNNMLKKTGLSLGGSKHGVLPKPLLAAKPRWKTCWRFINDHLTLSARWFALLKRAKNYELTHLIDLPVRHNQGK